MTHTTLAIIYGKYSLFIFFKIYCFKFLVFVISSLLKKYPDSIKNMAR